MCAEVYLEHTFLFKNRIQEMNSITPVITFSVTKLLHQNKIFILFGFQVQNSVHQGKGLPGSSWEQG